MTALGLIRRAVDAGALRRIHTSASVRGKATKGKVDREIDWKKTCKLINPDTNLIEIKNATFYRQYPSPTVDQQHNPKLFPNLNFKLRFFDLDRIHIWNGRITWCIVGPSLSGKTAFLEVLQGKHICVPPTGRTFHVDQQNIRYAGFDTAHRGGGLGQLTSTYLAERYESRRELTDFSLRDYLLDNTQLNPASAKTVNQRWFYDVVNGLKLKDLLDLPLTFLSNGQGRRALIAHALLQRPAILLLDEPFMGLDPPTVKHLTDILRHYATNSDPYGRADPQHPTLVLTSRPQDPLPGWITNIAYLATDGRVAFSGTKANVYDGLQKYVREVREGSRQQDPTLPLSLLANLNSWIGSKGGKKEISLINKQEPSSEIMDTTRPKVKPGEPVVEMSGCAVKYGQKTVLGNWEQRDKGGTIRKGLHWTVRRGERWAVFGPNGSGKTTIVSLLCSDHPQTYSLPIKLFGRSRLPDPGSNELPLTFWDIQARIGHSSPEVHQHMPRGLSVRQVLENAWADTFRSKPQLDDWAVGQIDATLARFAPEIDPLHDPSSPRPLDWANTSLFGELSFSAQRVLLFLRAIIKHPDIVVLDEAFSGMDVKVRDKCMSWLEIGTPKGENEVVGEVPRVEGLSDQQALICISHVREEVPDSVSSYMCLPEANTKRPAQFGTLSRPLRSGNSQAWDNIWGLVRTRKHPPQAPSPKEPLPEAPSAQES